MGKAVYEIALAGSYESDADANVLDFYLARFNTKANFTTNIYESNTLDVSEQVNGVYIDADNERIYAVVDVNTNSYFNRTIYEPGDIPSDIMNPNIAIIGFSFDYGLRLWTTLLGDPENVDYFVGLSIYDGHVYAVLNSHTSTYSTDETQTDIIYAKIRGDNGYVVNKQTLGSPSSDEALDISAGQAGVYIMATIGDEFLPHYDNTKYWETNGGAGLTNFAMLLIRDSDNTLIDIEGYDFATMTDPYPKAFSLALSTTSRHFTFYSHRANDDVNGFYMTTFTNSSLVFVNDDSTHCTDTTNCFKCNANDASMCMICQASKLFYNNDCHDPACPRFSHQAADDSGTSIDLCEPCHFTCETCVGPKSDMCMTCCSGGLCGTTELDRDPLNGMCICPTGTLESNGQCTSQCETGLRARYNDYCLTECPNHSYKYLDCDRTGAYQEYSDVDSTSATQ